MTPNNNNNNISNRHHHHHHHHAQQQEHYSLNKRKHFSCCRAIIKNNLPWFCVCIMGILLLFREIIIGVLIPPEYETVLVNTAAASTQQQLILDDKTRQQQQPLDTTIIQQQQETNNNGESSSSSFFFGRRPSNITTATTTTKKPTTTTKTATSTTTINAANIPQKKHAFVCITGQRQRLELKNKVKYILKPLRDAGYNVHIALLITDETKARFTNPIPKTPATFENYKDAHKYLVKHNFTVVTHEATIQTEKPTMRDVYLQQMDKGHSMTQEQRVNRVSNHLRQFQVLTKCGEAMMEATSSLSQQQQEENNQQKSFNYDLILRARDDSGLLEPLKVDKIVKILFHHDGKQQKQKNNNNNVVEPTILSSDCRTFAGMNDRLAIVTPNAAFHYFMDPMIHMYTQSIHKNVNNPETYLLYTYLAGGMTILQSSYLRGVVKLDTLSELKANEDKTHCPEPDTGGTILRSSKHTQKRGDRIYYKEIKIK